jgi:hypothetical protein
MDANALASLIQSHHLTDEALSSYRSDFESTRARFSVIDDFLVPETAERLSEFLRKEAEFQSEHGLYSTGGHKVEEAEWLAAPEDERFFRYGKLVGTPPQFQFSPNSLAYLKFRTAFQTDDNLRTFFAEWTGLELARSDDFGSHSMGVGDFLKEHDDSERNRQLALVLYLSPGWKPEFGGGLHITDESGGEWTVEPTYNSIVVFDTLAGTKHYVAPVRDAAGEQRRVTIGGWYHAPD